MQPKFHEITSLGTVRLPQAGVESWDDDGVLILEDFIPHDLIDAYVEERTRLLHGTPKWRSGWNGPTPYLHVPSMKNLALHRPLTQAIQPLIGWHEPGLHLCLTGFQSTERQFHQDAYLNPEFVKDHYIAAWIALDDIHEDSGVFQYAPGSHKAPVIQREKVWSSMKHLGQDPSLPTWPSDSQDWVGKACEEFLEDKGVRIKSFVPKKGTVLLWHSYLIHRGSKPKNPELERRALICHFSSIDSRPDMPVLKRHPNGSYFFHFDHVEPEESTHRSKVLEKV